MSNPHPVHMFVLGGHLSGRCCASLWGPALDKQDAAGPQLMPVHHDSKHRVACLPMLLVVSHKASRLQSWAVLQVAGSKWMVTMLDLF